MRVRDFEIHMELPGPEEVSEKVQHCCFSDAIKT